MIKPEHRHVCHPVNMPVALHWLGDRHEGAPCARDARGCVLYFDTEADCLRFMKWLGALRDDEAGK